MAKIINEKIDCNLLVREFEKIMQLKNGQVKFEAFRSDDLIVILKSALVFINDFPDCEKRGILEKSLFSWGRKGKFNFKNLMDEINYHENIFLNLPKIKYKMVTSISINYSKYFKPIRSTNFAVYFYSKTPSKFDQSEIIKQLKYSNRIIKPLENSSVIVTTEGRSVYEAVEKAISFFELIRGIWNFYNNRFTYRRIVSGKQIPVNTILLGPFHTLHEPEGKLAITDYWYEILHSNETKAVSIAKNFPFIKEQEKIVRKRLENINYGAELKKVFIRYTNALDIIDFSTSIVNLWGILEYLTNTTDGRYDKTISRTAFLYHEHKFVKQILENLRVVRNKIVHTSSRDDTSELLVYQLKEIVENMILFHLFNPYKFSSVEEVGNFLDLPKNSNALRKKYKIITAGLKFKKLR